MQTFPDFNEWRTYVKEGEAPILSDQLLDIDQDKAGVLRTNQKFMFPQDNSIINVNKYNVCQKRMGESKIIKDNYVFGLREKEEQYAQKAPNEEQLRNRDAKEVQHKDCDFWLVFDNGVKMLVEMQEHLDIPMK